MAEADDGNRGQVGGGLGCVFQVRERILRFAERRLARGDYFEVMESSRTVEAGKSGARYWSTTIFIALVLNPDTAFLVIRVLYMLYLDRRFSAISDDQLQWRFQSEDRRDEDWASHMVCAMVSRSNRRSTLNGL